MTGRDRMTERVRSFMEKWNMTEPGDTVILGLSGGADSAALFAVLLELKDAMGFALRAVHVHHGLRGSEADRDLKFSRELCKRAGVPFLAEYIDAAGEAKQAGLSVEEAGRIARYRIFRRELLSCGGKGKIAVAHHADDRAETVLFHLFRGTGLRGLGGIYPVQGDIIRPLLSVQKSEIVEFLRERGLSWVEDATNRDQEYARNYIRGTILPGVQEHVNAQASKNILRTADFAAEADGYFRYQAEKMLDRIPPVRKEGALAALPAESLLAEETILRGYLVREMLLRAGCPAKDITARHIADILDLAGKSTGKEIMLPGGLRARKSYGLLVFSEASENGAGGEEASSRGLPEDIAGRFSFRLVPRAECGKIPDAEYTKWLDCATIKDTLSIRSREKGDYICLAPGVRKSIHRFMIDEKIPAAERDRVPLLADGNHILWIVGYRISWGCRITEQTENVLQVCYQPEGGKNIG